MRDYLIAIIAMPAMVILWVVVDNLYRRFSLRHPQFRAHPQGGCGACAGGDEGASCHAPRETRKD